VPPYTLILVCNTGVDQSVQQLCYRLENKEIRVQLTMDQEIVLYSINIDPGALYSVNQE